MSDLSLETNSKGITWVYDYFYFTVNGGHLCMFIKPVELDMSTFFMLLFKGISSKLLLQTKNSFCSHNDLIELIMRYRMINPMGFANAS